MTPTSHPDQQDATPAEALRDKSAALAEALRRIAEGAGSALEVHLPVRDMVRAKVEAMSPRAMEEMLFSILAKEFGFIEWSGAALGGLVGIAQTGLMFAMR